MACLHAVSVFSPVPSVDDTSGGESTLLYYNKYRFRITLAGSPDFNLPPTPCSVALCPAFDALVRN